MFSIIIPLYNKADYIAETLKSVLNQTYCDYEVIVVNDSSTDNSLEVASSFQDERIHIYTKENEGVSAARNYGIMHAKYDYIAFLDADDWWESGKLKEQLKRLEETGYVLCSTGRELMKADGSSTGRTIPVKEKITYRELLKHNSINCSSVVLKTEVAKNYPMEHDDSHEDYITWLKILQKYKKACGIREPLLKYRLSNQGKSGNKLQSARMTFMVYRYLGFGILKSCYYFASYALHGVWKYYGFSGKEHKKTTENQRR